MSELGTNSTGSNANPAVTNPGPTAAYRARHPTATASGVSSRQNSIDGVPDIAIDLPPAPRASSPRGSTNTSEVADHSEVIVDLRDYLSMIDSDEETHVSSSEKTLDGCRDVVSPPPSSQWRHQQAKRSANQSRSPSISPQPEPRLPPWMHEMDKWEYVSSTAGGSVWKELLNVYLLQEERLLWKESVSNFELVFPHWINPFIGRNSSDRRSAAQDQRILSTRPQAFARRQSHFPKLRYSSRGVVEENPAGVASWPQEPSSRSHNVVLHPFWRLEGGLLGCHVPRVVGARIREAFG